METGEDEGGGWRERRGDREVRWREAVEGGWGDRGGKTMTQGKKQPWESDWWR